MGHRKDLPKTKLVVSDERMKNLSDRARKTSPHLDSLTHPEAIRRRLAAREQRGKAGQS